MRGACIIDQPYQVRLPNGMIRCYMAGDRVAGFGHQHIKAPDFAATRRSRITGSPAGTSIMHGPDARVPSAGIVIRAAARIEPHAAPGTMLCTEEFLSEVEERSQPFLRRSRRPRCKQRGCCSVMMALL